MKCFEKFKKKHTYLKCAAEIPEEELAQEDLKVLIMARKRRLDKAMPKTVLELKSRWQEVKVLSVMNAYEHLLDHGFPRDMIDIVLASKPKSIPNEEPDCTSNPLHLLAEAGEIKV